MCLVGNAVRLLLKHSKYMIFQFKYIYIDLEKGAKLGLELSSESSHLTNKIKSY